MSVIQFLISWLPPFSVYQKIVDQFIQNYWQDVSDGKIIHSHRIESPSLQRSFEFLESFFFSNEHPYRKSSIFVFTRFTNISRLFQCRNRICGNARFVYTYIDSRIFVVYLSDAFSFHIGVNPLAFARASARMTVYNMKDNLRKRFSIHYSPTWALIKIN